MIDPRLSWFAIGAAFSAVLFGWPWHSRFSRFSQFSRNIRSINYPDPAPNRQPTNAFTGKPVSRNKQLLTTASTSPTSVCLLPASSPSPQTETPSLEEALQALNALVMGGQTLMEVRNDYTTVRDALLHFAKQARLFPRP